MQRDKYEEHDVSNLLNPIGGVGRSSLWPSVGPSAKTGSAARTSCHDVTAFMKGAAGSWALL